MSNYLETFINGYAGYAGYLWSEITNPSWHNYFYWLLMVSGVFFLLEVVIPWRKEQKTLRKDFWLDGFYMFFNFFLFSLIIYNAASDVVVTLFNDGIKSVFNGFDLQSLNPMQSWPMWAILITGFLVRDIVQWLVHRLLHRSEFLWQFHKVHHSVEEMGFAAHLRYHWMETVVYRTLEYIPLALLGIGLHDFFVIHIFTLAWGHYNHSNISIPYRVTGGVVGLLIGIVLSQNLLDTALCLDCSLLSQFGLVGLTTLLGAVVLGPLMPKLFNSPEMHIWHHSYHLPEGKRFGVNFGLTLAIWDYLFGTAHIPHDGKDIRLGFPEIEEFPTDFASQTLIGIKRK